MSEPSDTEGRKVSNLAAGKMQFLDNFIPTLRDGEYNIHVNQTLSGGTAKAGHTLPDGKKEMKADQLFTVRGPRFALPASDIHSRTPARGLTGQFEDDLPHVVLNKRGLPWERKLDAADGHVPWMALIVLRADELLVVPTDQLDKDGQLKIGNEGVPEPKGLANPTQAGNFVLNQVLGPVYPDKAIANFDPRGGIGGSGPPPDTQGPCLGADNLSTDEREVIVPPPEGRKREKPLLSCRAIDISTKTFAAVVPKLSDAVHLSHVRQVDTGDKEILGIKDDGWFSVVVANRFPSHDANFPKKPARLPGTTPYVAHLVSLEGFEAFLGKGDPIWADGISKVRMVSLASWAFNVLPDSAESFADLMNGLIQVPKGEKLDLKLRMPASVPENADDELAEAIGNAAKRLQDGYVPLSYRTRPGEHTFAWYRGPFTPSPVPFFLDATGDETGRVPSPTRAAEAYIYDPETGVFDLSCGVAFMTGRTMALADPVFAQNVLNWRRKMHQILDLIQARIQSDHLPKLTGDDGRLTQIAAHELEELLEERLLASKFVAKLVGELGEQILPKGTKNEPRKTPFQPPENVRDASVREQLDGILKEPAVKTLLSKLPEALPEEIIVWLAKRMLLDGVPFDNLVPAAAMLPVESIRFFHLDPNWLSCLIDGAFSIGTHTSRDTGLYQIMRGPIFEGVYETVHRLRDRMRNVEGPDEGAGSKHLSGFLLRSAVVSGWPGLEVKAFTNADGSGEELKLLRMERLSPDVLLVMFPGVPRCVQLNEPFEGLGFGYEKIIRTDDAAAQKRKKENKDKNVFELRHISGTDSGTPIAGDKSPPGGGEPLPKVFELKWISVDQMRVLDVAKTVEQIATGIGVSTAAIKPAAFALNMVKVPEQMLFENPG